MKRRFPYFYTLVGFLAAGMLYPAVPSAQPVCPLDTLKPRIVESLKTFKGIPVLDQGRIKPMETHAQNFLLRLSGRRSYQKESGAEWFARFLFAPRTTFDDKIFLINHPEIAEALQIEPEKRRRYSYRQLEAGYDKLRELAIVAEGIDAKSQSVVEREIVRVYSNLHHYLKLSGVFIYGFPHPDFTIGSREVIELLQLPKDRNQFSFFDIVEKSHLLSLATAPLERKPSDSWNETEKELVRLMKALFFWAQNYSDGPLGLIPTKDHDTETWLSPMDVIQAGFSDPVYRKEVELVRDMTVHYWNNSQLEFDLSVRAFMDSVAKRLSPQEKKAVAKIPLELFYNNLNPFLWAKLFYGLGFLLFLCSLIFERKWFYPVTLASIGLAAGVHLLALVLRILIMSRPPVSNLYETFLFVGLITVILGAVLELVNRNWLGVVVSSTCGLIFLFIAGKFSSDGDTMQMLVAVLDSNFWLSTHVLSITTGYAGCCVAGIVGHVYILQALARPRDKKRLEVTFKNMMGILGFGLTMTFLGTTLGGIWADQSWGRFWGWDPKENGALLIVLWCAIIFHARISKIINPLGAAAGCVFGLIVVMWAWFGVNLLSVGLHSYGFTSGVANSLAAYVIAELIFIAVTVTLLGKKNFKF